MKELAPGFEMIDAACYLVAKSFTTDVRNFVRNPRLLMALWQGSSSRVAFLSNLITFWATSKYKGCALVSQEIGNYIDEVCQLWFG